MSRSPLDALQPETEGQPSPAQPKEHSLSKRIVSTVIATKNYYNADTVANTLQLMQDDVIYVLSKPNAYWWDGLMMDPVGNITRGWFPVSHTKPYKLKKKPLNNPQSQLQSQSHSENGKKPLRKMSVMSNDSATIVEDPSKIDEHLNKFSQKIGSNTPSSSPSTHLSQSPNMLQSKNKRYSLKPRNVAQSHHHHYNYKTHPSRSIPDIQNVMAHQSSVSTLKNESINHNNNHHGHNHIHNHHHPHNNHHYNHLSHRDDSLSSSSHSIFKEKNYFVTKQESVSSSTSNQYDSRQSSQAFTDNSSSSMPFCVVSNEEVSSYFKPSGSELQPSFNFVPVWIPQFDQNYNVLYKNQTLNIYTDEIPFVDSNYIDEKSLYESPDTSNLVKDIKQLPFALQGRQNSEVSSINMNTMKQKGKSTLNNSYNSSNTTTTNNNYINTNSSNNSNNNDKDQNTSIPSKFGSDPNSTNYPKSNHNYFNAMYNLPTFVDSRPTEIFYTHNTDILTYDNLNSSFINLIDKCIYYLRQHDKLNYNIMMNSASTTFSLYHVLGRLIRHRLIDSNLIKRYSVILKKLSKMFIQFKIWASLSVITIDKIELYQRNLVDELNILPSDNTGADFKNSETGNKKDKPELELHTDDVITEKNLDYHNYLVDSYILDLSRIRNKIEKLSTYLSSTFTKLNMGTLNDSYQYNNSNLLPMLYPRFIRNKFEAGNFKNKFVDLRTVHNDFFINPQHKISNVLLDDNVISKLDVLEKKISTSLTSFNDILGMKLTNDASLTFFLEEKNLKLLTAVYQSIPLFASFIDLVESIDLTVFAMIDKLAVKCVDNERHDTIISKMDNSYANESTTSIDPNSTNATNNTIKDDTFSDSPVISENDRFTDNNDENDNNSQSFYDATAKVFRPMIQDFIHLKQSIHTVFTDLILDSQTITAIDPESFFSIKDDKNVGLGNSSLKKLSETLVNNPADRIKVVADVMMKRFEALDKNFVNDGIFSLEPSLKLIETIKLTKKRIKLIVISISQLKEERRLILNYCTRLMNTDFNVASLFIAERHNTLVSKISDQSQSMSKSVSTYQSISNDIDDNLNINNDNSNMPSNELNNYFNGSDIDPNSENLNDNILEENIYDNYPWYIGPDHNEQQLIYEGTTLRGGPIKGLISKLVNPLNPYDQLFEESFLCFFSTFIKPVKLFEILIDKFYTNMPEALSYEEYGIWLEQKLKPQQRKILEIFEKLFSKYWIVGYTSPELINTWEVFLEDLPSADQHLCELSNIVLSFKNQQDYIDYVKRDENHIKHIPRSPLNNHILHLKLQSMNVNYVAEQITAMQSFYYKELNLWDLLGRSYNFNRIFKKKNERVNNLRDPLGTKNIATFIKNCNNLTHYTTFMILKNSSLEQRVDSIKYFILLAESLLRLKNFSSMTAIISGLGSTSISRLKKTWELVPANFVSKFEKMDNLMSIGKNYSEYRNILKFVETDGDAYLPFLGMYLSDLRFTTDGNPDWLGNKKGSKGIVNFSKRVSIMKIIKEVLSYNNNLYDIKIDPEFSRYIHEMFKEVPDDEKLYELSIEIEPRVSLLKNVINPHEGTQKSISSINTVDLNNIFGSYTGSVSTVSSSQVSDHGLSPTAASSGHHPTKQGGYRSLLSLTTVDSRNSNKKNNEANSERRN